MPELSAVVMLGLAATAGLAGLYLIACAANRTAAFLRHFALVWRFLSGHTHNGQYHTNATWTRWGDKVLHPTGRAHPWHYLPRLARAGIRTGTVAAIVAAVYGLIAAFFLTAVLLAVTGSAAAAAGSWLGWRAACHWKRHRPLHRAVARELGMAPRRLEIERDKSKTVVWVPDEFTGDTRGREALTRAVAVKVPMEAPDADWSQLHARRPCVVFTRSEPPPFPVSWEDVAAAVRAAAASELVFGLGKRGVIAKASYGQSPHLAIPGGSGGGKSNLAAFLLLQEMIRGSLIFNLDPKWISHLWLQDLPNVINAHDTPDLHLALAWLGRELLRRTKAAWYSARGTGRVRGNVGPRIIVLCEELNYGMDGLKDYWREIRDRKTDPKQSPAIAGLKALSCAGRASDMHEWLVAQLMTAASTGVADSTIRTNCGITAFPRWDPPGWAMSVGKHVPMPPQTTIPGRIQLVTGDAPREVQVPYLHLDDKDTAVSDRAVAWARHLAVSGDVAKIPTGPQGVPPQLWPPGVLGQTPRALTAGQGSETPGTVPPIVTMTYREAIARGVFGDVDAAGIPRLAEAVRKALQRAGTQPALRAAKGAAHKYYLTDLEALAKEMRPR